MRRSRRRAGGGKLILITILFWAVSGIVVLALVNETSALKAEETGQNIGTLYVESVFPQVSRGMSDSVRSASAGVDAGAEDAAAVKQTGEEGTKEKKETEKSDSSVLKKMIAMNFPVIGVEEDGHGSSDLQAKVDGAADAQDGQAQGTATEPAKGSGGTGTGAPSGDQVQPPVQTPAAVPTPVPEQQNPVTKIDSQKPLVIIYHTHATESYQPVTEGNFHALGEEGTVRQVGDVMEAELKAKGIQVVHDKTLHDHPSYNQSYGRSLNTVKTLLAKYPQAKVVVDLHRDAAAYSGNVGKVVKIDGKNVAKYNLVVGQGNPNVNKLMSFANQINAKAEALYPGFGGRIIEKQYKFNQYVADNDILLEVGNNQNNIEEVKLTGKYFANVLAEVIKELP